MESISTGFPVIAHVHASVASILSGTVCHTYISYACYDLTLVGSCFYLFHSVSYHFMFRGYATDIRHVRLGRPGQKGIGRQMMWLRVGILLFVFILFFFGSSQPAVEDFPIVQIKMDILAPLCGFMTCYVWRHFACSVFLFLSLHATVFNGGGV